MAGLLVSVRSAVEAVEAWDAGATVIDVKEPRRGPLGRADEATIRSVRSALPDEATVSVALGELAGWQDRGGQGGIPGVSYHKLGLAGAGDDWARRWRAVVASSGDPARWVAVVYADWQKAGAPSPSSVVEEAIRSGCGGLLIDTWDKSRPSPLAANGPWADLTGQARSHGLFVALAGRLDERAIVALSPLRPDLYAVRGAACRAGDRLGPIDGRRVEALARLVSQVSTTGPQPVLARFTRSSPSTG